MYSTANGDKYEASCVQLVKMTPIKPFLQESLCFSMQALFLFIASSTLRMSTQPSLLHFQT